MHITFQTQTQSTEPSILCVDRTAGECRVIVLNIEHLETIEQIAKSLGVNKLVMSADIWPRDKVPARWIQTEEITLERRFDET